MKENLGKKLNQILPAEQILEDEPMWKHTTFKIGGPADFFVIAKTKDEVEKVVKIAKEEKIPFVIMGNGSNILVTDKGIRGIVLKIAIQEMILEKREGDTYFYTVGAGYPIIKASYEALKNSLTGLEFASGIPGTIGGAVRMNAGAYGHEIKEILVEATYLDEEGKIQIISAEEQELSYRHSIFCLKDWIILSTKIALKKGNIEEIKQVMEQNSTSRKAKQPIDKPSAGSTFKRGEGYITAALIDQCGLKGYTVGGASISRLHAGFVVNNGNATAEDVLAVIQHTKETVKKTFDKDIQLEIEIIGEK